MLILEQSTHEIIISPGKIRMEHGATSPDITLKNVIQKSQHHSTRINVVDIYVSRMDMTLILEQLGQNEKFS